MPFAHLIKFVLAVGSSSETFAALTAHKIFSCTEKFCAAAHQV